MPEEKEFTKVHAEKPVAREIKAIAAMQGLGGALKTTFQNTSSSMSTATSL